jgi:uncharacterized protein
MIFFATINQYAKMLKNLSAILDIADNYAAEKKFEPEILWQARLAPDQFNFIRQIQVTCDTAKYSAASWANVEAPTHPDTEKSLPELKARIASVVSYLGSFKADDFKGAAERKIMRPRWEGKHLLGEEFMIEHAVPNFYFHLTTAYSILRNQGVKIGKKNYLGTIAYRN